MKMCTAATRLEVSGSALQYLSLRPKGKKILVPLTASLYVPGYLDDAEVLVDVGTGYFIKDLDAVEALIQGLVIFQGGVLMVSHDEHLITNSVDELWAVSQAK